jgi:hypothetical protein
MRLFRRISLPVAALLTLTLSTPVLSGTPQAPQDGFVEIIKGAKVPLKVTMKDLTGGAWRRMTVSGAGGLAGPDASPMVTFITSILQGPDASAYFTRGETVTVDGQKFLVAYRVKPKPIDFEMLDRSADPPKPDPLKPDTELTLSLLNLSATNSFEDIRPFDWATEQAAIQAREAEERKTRSVSNLKQLALGVLMYVQDYDEVLPPMQTPEKAQEVIQPYVKNLETFRDPVTGAAYIPNPTLSQKKVAHIANPADFVLYFEPKPAPDGTRGVAFLDGSVKRIKEEDWPRHVRASKIPPTAAGTK